MTKKYYTMTIITFNFKNLLSCFLLVSMTCFLNAQENDFVRKRLTLNTPSCKIPLGEYTGLTSTLRSPEVLEKIARNDTPCSNITVNYSGYTPEAQAAFAFAVELWEHSIESPVEIVISASYESLGGNTLAQAGPAGVQTVNPALAPDAIPNTFYPKALAEKLEGVDSDIPGLMIPDVLVTFSSDFPFYFGLDANPPSNLTDFVTVALHEIGHGLGFTGGWANVSPSFPDDIGAVREPNNNIPAIYSHFIENGLGESILSFPDPSAVLGAELTGNDLYCNSPTAIQQLNQGGSLPKIYAPASWNPGSSFSHWDENTFPAGDINALMTPQVAQGEANHYLGAITLGFFEDMGWSICPGALSVEDFAVSNVAVSPNPFVDEITVTLNKVYSDFFELKLIDINGRLIMSQKSDASNGRLTLSNLSDLDDSLYFVKITNSTTGNNITKKVMKN